MVPDYLFHAGECLREAEVALEKVFDLLDLAREYGFPKDRVAAFLADAEAAIKPYPAGFASRRQETLDAITKEVGY